MTRISQNNPPRQAPTLTVAAARRLVKTLHAGDVRQGLLHALVREEPCGDFDDEEEDQS
jgi:hypothetical protein